MWELREDHAWVTDGSGTGGLFQASLLTASNIRKRATPPSANIKRTNGDLNRGTQKNILGIEGGYKGTGRILQRVLGFPIGFPIESLPANTKRPSPPIYDPVRRVLILGSSSQEVLASPSCRIFIAICIGSFTLVFRKFWIWANPVFVLGGGRGFVFGEGILWGPHSIPSYN